MSNGVGLLVRVVGLGSEDPEFKSHSAVELIPGGVDSACHPSEVGKMSASLLVYCVGVATCPGLPNSQGDCFGSTNTAQSLIPMDGWIHIKEEIHSRVTMAEHQFHTFHIPQLV